MVNVYVNIQDTWVISVMMMRELVKQKLHLNYFKVSQYLRSSRMAITISLT